MGRRGDHSLAPPNVYGGNGNGDWYSHAPTGTGHRGAGGSSDTEPLARWRGSLGGGEAPGLAGAAARGTGEFFYTGAELFAWGTGCPWAHPFEDTGLESEIDMVSLHLPLPGGKVRVGGMALRETMLLVRLGSTAERAGATVRVVGVGDDVAKGGVYTLRDAAGKVVRTGRSRDLARRELEHAGDFGDYVFRVEYRTDVLAQQRGLEEILYRRYPEAMAASGGFNKIGAISERNANRTLYLEAAEQYLGGRW